MLEGMKSSVVQRGAVAGVSREDPGREKSPVQTGDLWLCRLALGFARPAWCGYSSSGSRTGTKSRPAVAGAPTLRHLQLSQLPVLITTQDDRLRQPVLHLHQIGPRCGEGNGESPVGIGSGRSPDEAVFH